MWLSGVKLETISSQMGHEDTKTTIQYLGINMDDRTEAMSKLSKFMQDVKNGQIMTGSNQSSSVKNLHEFGEASKISGQSGT